MSSINRRMCERASYAAALLTTGTVGLVLAACAPVTRPPPISQQAYATEAEKERDLVVDEWVTQYHRLLNVAYPILEKNADQCRGRTRPSLEAEWATKQVLGKPYEE